MGVTHTHTGRLVMCVAGLHASVHPEDALTYAPGSTLWLVECGGEIVRDANKLVCSERTYLARLDAAPLLRAYARWCALQVAHLWDCPPVVRTYLETGEESLRDATWDATRAVAWDATRAVAWDATRDAQRAEFARLVDAAFAGQGETP